MYINRELEDTFFKYNKEYPVMLLTGQRQCGKTTMLEKDVRYISPKIDTYKFTNDENNLIIPYFLI